MFDGNFEEMPNESDVLTCDETSGMTLEAKKIACQIQKNFDSFVSEVISIEVFSNEAEKLRVSAESLKDKNESLIIGITASISKHSVQFWNQNFQKYYSTFYGLFSQKPDRSNGPNAETLDISPLKINWWTFAGSDLMGAWRWGRVGAVVAGGPAGAVACGLAGAAGHSSANLIGQGILQTIRD